MGNWCVKIGLYVRKLSEDRFSVREKSENNWWFRQTRISKNKFIFDSSHIYMYLQIENINLEELPAPAQVDRNARQNCLTYCRHIGFLLVHKHARNIVLKYKGR